MSTARPPEAAHSEALRREGSSISTARPPEGVHTEALRREGSSTLSTQPFCFGSARRRLFGIYHPSAAGAATRAGVVLCNPFGQEGVRAHRALWVLAERLARAGHPVLRFDYFGAGDSMGDDLDADLDGWTGDVHEADQALRARSGSAQTIWFGMRLGGAVVLRAAQRAPATLLRLLLWDPVTDGQRYLEQLRERHAASLEAAFSLPLYPLPAHLLRDPAQYRDEAIGFAVSPLLRQQLAGLRPQPGQWPSRPASIVALADPGSDDGRDLAALCAQDPQRLRLIAFTHGTDWTSDTADNGVLVPAQALTLLVQQAALPT